MLSDVGRMLLVTLAVSQVSTAESAAAGGSELGSGDPAGVSAGTIHAASSSPSSSRPERKYSKNFNKFKALLPTAYLLFR